jgi:hypothetical protein
MRLVKAGETTAARRRVHFDIRGTDGITPVTDAAGGQPQISVNDAAWTDTGIGVLVAIGNGRYYAELTAGTVGSGGTWVETRYKGASTAETPGDSAQVVGFDPAAAFELGPAGLDSIVVETGVNGRQALALAAAIAAGEISGAATDTVVIKGANVATTRVTATTDADGNRTDVTLSLPA